MQPLGSVSGQGYMGGVPDSWMEWNKDGQGSPSHRGWVRSVDGRVGVDPPMVSARGTLISNHRASTCTFHDGSHISPVGTASPMSRAAAQPMRKVGTCSSPMSCFGATLPPPALYKLTLQGFAALRHPKLCGAERSNRSFWLLVSNKVRVLRTLRAAAKKLQEQQA